MRVLFAFLRSYPSKSAITLGALMVAGLFEGLGLSLLMPMLAIVMSGEGTLVAEETSGINSTLVQMVRDLFESIGLTPSIGAILILFVALMIIKSLIMLAAHKHVGYTMATIITDMRLKLVRALFKTRWEYFITRPAGSLTNSIATEATRSAGAYMEGIRIITAFLHALVYTTVALLVSWKATLAALAVSMMIIILFRRYIRKSKKAGLRQTKLLQSLMSVMTESMVMIKPLKTMGREHLADAVLQKKIEALKKVIKKQIYAGTALSAFRDPVTIAFLAAGLYWVLVIWKLPIASMLVIVYMLQKVMKRVNKMQTIYQHLMTKESAYWSLTAKVEAASQMKEVLTGDQKVSLRHSICLENVSFSYDDERWILRNASLDFPAGSFTAIVGPSGIGKTTVIDLVTGLLRPQAGEILIDNIPLAEIDIRYWRQKIGYVPQETLLLNDAIFLNVTLGDRQLSNKDVENALRAAGAWEFVQAMPDGIHTMVGEQGYKLSGGQRQRIAIARALVHQPRLLILDEATTALDPKNEAAICETLQGLKGKHTLMAISHQPAILKVAERAYRLEDGKAFPVKDLLSQIHHEIDLSTATA